MRYILAIAVLLLGSAYIYQPAIIPEEPRLTATDHSYQKKRGKKGAWLT